MTSHEPAPSRRAFLRTGGALLGVAALSGCSVEKLPTPTTTAQQTNSDYSGVTPAATIDYWSCHPGAMQAIEVALVEQFNRVQSQVTVRLVDAGSTAAAVADKLSSTPRAIQPAVMMVSDTTWFPIFLRSGLLPLNNLLSHHSVNTGDYVGGFLQSFAYGGTQWALPVAPAIPLFVYNRSHFLDANLPDRAPLTWNEFQGWLPDIYAVNGGKTVHLYSGDHEADGWQVQNEVWSQSGALSNNWTVTCNSNATVLALRYRQAAIREGFADVSAQVAQDFARGKSTTAVLSTQYLGEVVKSARFTVSAGSLPGPGNGNPVCPTGGYGLVVPASTTKAEQVAAGMFLKFLGQPENSVQISSATGFMPVRKSSDLASVVKAMPQFAFARDQLALLRTQDWARVYLPNAAEAIGAASTAITVDPTVDAAGRLAALKTLLEDRYTSDVQPILG